MSSSDVVVMSNKLLELKMKASALRTEVELLNSTKHTLDMNALTANKAKTLRAKSEEVNKNDNTEEACDRKEEVTKEAKKKKKYVNKSCYTLPSEYVNEIQAKAGEVRVVMLKHDALTREKKDLQTLLDRAVTRNQESEQEYIRLMEMAGVHSYGGQSQHLNKIQQVNYFNSLLTETARLYEQRNLLQTQLKEQTNELHRLSMVLEESTKAREQERDARHILEMKTAKVNELRATRERLERTVKSKDQILAKPNRGPTAEDYVKAATQDRRVALLELTRERNYVSENEKAIEHRALQIAKLEKRLQMIGDIVAGDDLDDVEPADVELIDALMNEISALHVVCDETNVRITIMDAEIEKLEEKVRAFQRSTVAANKEMDKIEINHEQYVKTVNNELKRAEILTEDIIIEKREIDQLLSICEDRSNSKATAKPHNYRISIDTKMNTTEHATRCDEKEHATSNIGDTSCLPCNCIKLDANDNTNLKEHEANEADNSEIEFVIEELKNTVHDTDKLDTNDDEKQKLNQKKLESDIEFIQQSHEEPPVMNESN